ncbi:ATP-binding protein [Microvirga sp. 2MCAF38]|uniref:sensor histidine kinase n=1 Tax=Microvirga sp. 2MCAF38 TaxID=3232989 RepID=UPI003F991679
MLTNSTWNRVDGWLEGFLEDPSGADPFRVLQVQRFVIVRAVVALVALIALFPLALIHQSSPGLLEGTAMALVMSQLAAAFVLLRFRSLDAAQALASTVLAFFVALSSLEEPIFATLAFMLIPMEVASFRSRRAIALAVALIVPTALVAVGLPKVGIGIKPVGMEVVFSIGMAFLLGHMVAHAFSVRRMDGLLHRASLAGDRREADVLATIDDLVTWHDGMGAVLRASSAAPRLLGASSSTLRGIGLFQRIHVGDRPAYLKALSDAAHGSTPARARIRVRSGATDAPGMEPRMIWLEMRAHRLPTSSDERGIVVAMMREIDEHQAELERLEATHREVVSLAEGRARLLTTAGHALRKPLMNIQGYSTLLMEHRGRSNYAEIIRQDTERMLESVDALLTLSAIEAERYALAYEQIDVATLLTEVCATVAADRQNARLDIRCEMPPALPRVRADRKAFRQILLALLSNAFAATPQDGEIFVKAHVDGRSLSLSVKHSGLSSPTNDAEIAGARLRLALVRALVDLHGGRVSLAEVGQGAHVHINLPIEADRPLQAESHSVVRSMVNSHSGVRLLKAG